MTQPACIDQWTRRPLTETVNHCGRSRELSEGASHRARSNVDTEVTRSWSNVDTEVTRSCDELREPQREVWQGHHQPTTPGRRHGSQGNHQPMPIRLMRPIRPITSPPWQSERQVIAPSVCLRWNLSPPKSMTDNKPLSTGKRSDFA